jgi:hypothetical protein
MAENTNDNTYLWLALIGVAFYAVSLKSDNNDLKAAVISQSRKIRNLESNYLQLLHAYLDRVNELPEGVRQQLEYLMENYNGINPDISAELQDIMTLIYSDQKESAVLKLAKIIENILKDHLINQQIIAPKSGFPSLASMIQKSHDMGIITPRESQFITLIKDYRNEEAHRLNLNLSPNQFVIAILSGIEILHKFHGVLKQS